ncbi:hypothetical protein BST81_11605 [Leptolyngbya sp. 'hensonii']|uniref:hypothetical protein n=1 Tax=Leptolyngbya sp. 'hensonii' TaxID=1922337 RepID=UPI00094F88F2|nr:hypothetical protein [Leptolyngbya sp. 'hensonii']OLP18253.1 hypothetical protein BST81_11605 [Leptolyngbya sp. 'hensonii']
MDELNDRLYQLILETCVHPPGSLNRQKGLSQLIELIQRSQKLWRDTIADYEDALQQTWLYFCRNLCEATTGEAYDPARATVITWMNSHLKWRLQDLRQQAMASLTKKAFSESSESDEGFDLIGDLRAPPIPPPILEEVLDWVEREASQLRRIHVRDRPDVNAQMLILRRLPPATSWDKLAAEFRVPVATLSGFYQRECLPRLLKFGKSQGYLEER